MSKRWILTALGRDRPGIVAQVTKVLYDLRGNLEDSAMTRLAGEFVIMLTFSAPAALTQQRLESAFQAVSRRLALAVHLKALAPAHRAVPKGARYAIAVYGAHRPGIVYRVSSVLAAFGINIIDLATQRAVRVGKPLYLLTLEVELSKRVRPESLERRLKALAKPLGVSISLRPADTDVL